MREKKSLMLANEEFKKSLRRPVQHQGPAVEIAVTNLALPGAFWANLKVGVGGPGLQKFL